MHVVSQFLTAVVRIVFKLLMLAAALLFILSLLCVAMVSVVVVLLKSLLTGRKPAFVSTFSRFSQASQQFRSGEWPTQGRAGFAQATADDVMDVQAREIRADPALPHEPAQNKP